jgi:hypothetical protein
MLKPHPQLRASLASAGGTSVVLTIRNNSKEEAFVTSYNLPSADGTLDNSVFDFKDMRPRIRGQLAKRGEVGLADCVTLAAGAVYETTVDIARWYELPAGGIEVAYLAFHDYPPALEATAVCSNYVRISKGGAQ